MSINIVFGSGGLIGSTLIQLVKKKKNYIFYSKKSNKFIKKWDLKKSLKKFPHKYINTLFFFASPRFIKKNFNIKIYANEIIWLKNIVSNLDISKIVYISSPSIFYKKAHFVGKNKLACEKYLKRNKIRFDFIQIWRPYNLVGQNQNHSDHFHNYAIKKMFEDQKSEFTFSGSSKDRRGYSDVNRFVKKLLYYSKKDISFTKNYGNKDVIKTSDIIKVYNFYYMKIFFKEFKAKFASRFANISKVTNGKNTIYEINSSKSVLKKYLIKYLREKKMLNLQ
jgi:hypothetical protein